MIKSLVKRSDLIVLQRDGQRVKRGPIQVQFLSSINGEDINSVFVGYAISRNIGSAVFRNKIRRQLRESMSQIYKEDADFPKGKYLIRVFPGIKKKNFLEINTAVNEVINELKKNGI